MNWAWYMEMNLFSLNFHGTNTPLTSSWRHPLSIEYLGICGFKEIQKIYHGVWVLMTSYFIILYKCFCEISFISILLRGYMGVRIWNSNSMCVYVMLSSFIYYCGDIATYVCQWRNRARRAKKKKSNILCTQSTTFSFPVPLLSSSPAQRDRCHYIVAGGNYSTYVYTCRAHRFPLLLTLSSSWALTQTYVGHKNIHK